MFRLNCSLCCDDEIGNLTRGPVLLRELLKIEVSESQGARREVSVRKRIDRLPKATAVPMLGGSSHRRSVPAISCAGRPLAFFLSRRLSVHGGSHVGD
jgi:hypothetical protein